MSWSVVGGPYKSVFVQRHIPVVATPVTPTVTSSGSRSNSWSVIGGPYKNVFVWTRRTSTFTPPTPVGIPGGGGMAGRGGRILDVGDSEYYKKKKIEDEIHALFKERERKAKELKATEIKLAYEEKASLAKKAESLYRKIADIEIEIQKLRAKREAIEIAEMDEVMEVYMVSRMVH